MTMRAFVSRFPELAMAETRTATITGHPGLPDGEYGFVEYYCDDPGCDCRRVVVRAMAPESGAKAWATISYGWEKLGYYQKRLGGNRKMALEAQGPSLDPLNPQSEHAGFFLELFRDMLKDEAYVERLKRHYALGRSKLRTVEAVVAKLEEGLGEFPREAMQLAVAWQKEITPHLLNMLDRARQDALNGDLDEDYFGHQYAMYLLAQFREARACPRLVELLRLPPDLVEELVGDTLTEGLPEILASICDGGLAPIQGLVEDPAVNEWARSSALRALVARYREGLLPRETLVDYFRRLLRGGLEREPAYVWNTLASCATEIHPGELLEDLGQAYDDELIEEFHIARHRVEAAAAGPLEEFLQKPKRTRPGLITDAIAEMEGWYCFQSEEKRASRYGKKRPASRDQGFPTDFSEAGWDIPLTSPLPPVSGHVETFVRESPKVGRNDPCPCGSGRKYKKCCGAGS